MKTKEQILKVIEQIEKDYDVKDVPEFIRGHYTALKWVLEEDENK